MATIGGDVIEHITSKVDLFGSLMQQNVIENELNRKYAHLETIKLNMPIKLRLRVQMTCTWG